jgi:uncharacterized protein
VLFKSYKPLDAVYFSLETHTDEIAGFIGDCLGLKTKEHRVAWGRNQFGAGQPQVRGQHEHCLRRNLMSKPPFPPFTLETAIQKVRMAEDAWNTRDPERVSLAYTEDSRWRNRADFPVGREEIKQFLTRKWSRELDYRLIKEIWAYAENRIAVRFAYEWRDDAGNWFRSYGNENWEFDAQGLMRLRFASINDLPIKEGDRKFHWPQGRRPDDHPGLSQLGL